MAGSRRWRRMGMGGRQLSNAEGSRETGPVLPLSRENLEVVHLMLDDAPVVRGLCDAALSALLEGRPVPDWVRDVLKADAEEARE
jgi:hypothetical protein